MRILLENKNAIVYGGGGPIGGAVSRAFACEGAHLFLAGRTLAKVEAVAEEISAAGRTAEAARVDALDEQTVDEQSNAVAEEAGASTSPSTPSRSGPPRAAKRPRLPWRACMLRCWARWTAFA